jgi:hypothetical protein
MCIKNCTIIRSENEREKRRGEADSNRLHHAGGTHRLLQAPLVSSYPNNTKIKDFTSYIICKKDHCILQASAVLSKPNYYSV